MTTIHRLLGARADTRHFRHNAANALALDVLVVDEASMVDIEMMTALLSALPASAKLVLLGIKTSWRPWKLAPCWATCAAAPKPPTTNPPRRCG
ncbi:hypothetical protein HORIV_46690 [Vreelandella olivaria]|uniref:Uncharacterized protein n=1 Tax=Vreelandella olivaria TaxID=390919 RepID=A0ABN5X073_9GAMM|nr:hypothetical protein HORIV_46690 [Halomonas olivaria]